MGPWCWIVTKVIKFCSEVENIRFGWLNQDIRRVGSDDDWQRLQPVTPPRSRPHFLIPHFKFSSKFSHPSYLSYLSINLSSFYFLHNPFNQNPSLSLLIPSKIHYQEKLLFFFYNSIVGWQNSNPKMPSLEISETGSGYGRRWWRRMKWSFSGIGLEERSIIGQCRAIW